jgi:8-hydroxy-5-deazaflavin:NADPH oxidoreductase
MKVGILGSGDVGQAIATGFANLDYEVKIGTSKPDNEKLKAWIEKTNGKKTSIGSFEEVAKFGDTIVLAVKGDSIEQALKVAGIENFNSKTVIGVTNPLDFSRGMPPKLLEGIKSGGETVQKTVPNAHVVKTLNIIGNASMVNPKFKQGEPDMLLCGNNESAKKKVELVLKEFGWKNITDIGDIQQSRIMEAMCILWVTYASKKNNWNIAFKMLTE